CDLIVSPVSDLCAIIKEMKPLSQYWPEVFRVRERWFEPTFHKHASQLCHGVQVHTEGPAYNHHAFKPWRLQALAFKAIWRLYPDYPLWRDFAYEYERDRLPIDVINGRPPPPHRLPDPPPAPPHPHTLPLLP